MKDPNATELGKKGGKKTAELHKGKHKEWGKQGGRPKKSPPKE